MGSVTGRTLYSCKLKDNEIVLISRKSCTEPGFVVAIQKIVYVTAYSYTAYTSSNVLALVFAGPGSSFER